MRRCSLILLTLAGLAACRDAPTDSSELMRIPVRHGTLFIDPAADVFITGGLVQYRIYGNGDIFYSGDISYFGDSPTTEVQVPFEGRYRVNPADVMSANYTVVNAERVIDKVTVEVDAVDAAQKIATLYAYVTSFDNVPSTDAQAYFGVDVSEPVIKITRADVTGTIFQNTEFETAIHLLLTENEPH